MGFQQDLLNRIINVKWSGGGFSFAGYISLDVVTPPTEDLPVGSVVPHFTWLGGTSKDGKSWKSAKSEVGLALFCCVRGKIGDRSVTVAAGDVLVGPIDFGPGYPTGYATEPAAGISYDDGLTWSDLGIPLQEYLLLPPNPTTGAGAHTAQGNCNAVVYHPATQAFYIGGSVFFSKGADEYFEDRMYRGTALVYSERREKDAPFTGYRWPTVEVTEHMNPEDRLRVADVTVTTPSDAGTLFVVSFSPKQKAEYFTTDGHASYVSVKDAFGVTLGGSDIHPPMAIVNSICGGMGHIVVVGWADEDERVGPVTFVSDDDGLTWTQQLSGLSNINPGPEDIDGGGSSGSCSFSS